MAQASKSAGLDDIVVTRRTQPIDGVPAKITVGHPTAEHQCLRGDLFFLAGHLDGSFGREAPGGGGGNIILYRV